MKRCLFGMAITLRLVRSSPVFSGGSGSAMKGGIGTALITLSGGLTVAALDRQ